MTHLPIRLFGLLAAALVASWAGGCSSSSNGGGTGAHAGGTGAHGGAGGGTDTCGPLVADEQGTPVTVRLVNHTSADIFVQHGVPQNCSYAPPFGIVDANHESHAAFTVDPCGSTCSNFSCTCTTTYTCATPKLLRIVPQGTASLDWGGTVLDTRTVPTDCLGANACSGVGTSQACAAWVKPKAYPLVFSSTGHTASGCESGPECTCTPDAQGSCELGGNYNFGSQGSALQGTGTLAAGGTSVDIVFE